MRWGLEDILGMREAEMMNDLGGAMPVAGVTVYDYFTNRDSEDVETTIIITRNIEIFQETDQLGSRIERSVEVEVSLPTSARCVQDEVIGVLDSDEESAGERRCTRSRFTGIERSVEVEDRIPTSARCVQDDVIEVLDSDEESVGERRCTRSRFTGFERPVKVTNEVPISPRRCQNVVTIDVDSEDEQSSDTMHREGAQEVEAGEKGEEVARDGLNSAARQGIERSVEVEDPLPTSARCVQDEVIGVLDSDEESVGERRCTRSRFTGFERPVKVTNQVPTSPRRCQKVVTIVVDSEDEQSSDTMHREGAQQVEAGEKGEEVGRDGLNSAARQG